MGSDVRIIANYTIEFDVTFIDESIFAVSFSDSDNEFGVTFSDHNAVAKGEYPGPYVVTPSRQNQILSTKDLIMAHNTVINSIPYRLVATEGGGLTAIIGGD